MGYSQYIKSLQLQDRKFGIQVHPCELSVPFVPSRAVSTATTGGEVNWQGDPPKPSPLSKEAGVWTVQEVLATPERGFYLNDLAFRDPERFMAG